MQHWPATSGWPPVISGMTCDTKARLEFLREVYLNEPIAGVPRLLPLPVPLAHDGFLHYVDDYARARVADSQERLDVALEYYKRALASLPQSHSAYDFALTRCNAIISIKSA
jgi:tetratricopeptide (TPR) repeat protein